MDFVAVGHVTLDQTPSGTRPGGGAYYAALTAHRLGLRAGILTSCGPDFPREALPPELPMVAVPADATTRFAFGSGAGGRTLTLLARAGDLSPRHCPAEWRAAPLAMLCPVAAEVAPAFATTFADAALGVLPQGWLRRAAAGGRVEPHPWAAPAEVLPHTQVLVVSQEDLGPYQAAALDWLQRVPVGAVTRGREGAWLFVNGERYGVAADRASEVDPTGAGDVFGAALLVEYQRDGNAWEAAAAATCAAAAAVEAPGAAGIPDRAGLAARLATYRRRRDG
jgi:1D-myo-inositol 3-kinase